MFETYQDPFLYGGEDPFGCKHCAGMGYLDYPTCEKPCLVLGHRERYESNFKDVMRMMDGLKRPYKKDDGNCPYCLSQKKPVGVECRHWTGAGWSRNR